MRNILILTFLAITMTAYSQDKVWVFPTSSEKGHVNLSDQKKGFTYEPSKPYPNGFIRWSPSSELDSSKPTFAFTGEIRFVSDGENTLAYGQQGFITVNEIHVNKYERKIAELEKRISELEKKLLKK